MAFAMTLWKRWLYSHFLYIPDYYVSYVMWYRLALTFLTHFQLLYFSIDKSTYLI